MAEPKTHEPVACTQVRASSGPVAGWLWALVMALVAMLLYTINLDRLPHHDELYHMLAAQGLIATGEPRVAEGIYTRGLLYTWIVAWFLEMFGASLTVARVPSLISMGVLVAALFLFVRARGGVAAGWLAAGLFAVSPFAIDLAQFTRFYALQSLVFFLACICTYELLMHPGGAVRQALLALLLVLLAALATHLQVTTLIGIAGLGFWGGAVLLARYLERPGTSLWRALALLGSLGLAGLAGLWLSGMLADLWELYRFTPQFNADNADKFYYYHMWLSLYYPTLWPLIGVLSLVAIAAHPKPAAFFLTIFATGFLINSLGASKSLRYIAYALPFLFALWGMSLAVLGQTLIGFTRSLHLRLEAAITLPSAWPSRLATVLLAGAAFFLVLGNPASIRSLTLLADITVPLEEPDVDWPAALPVLEPLAATANIVVTTDDLGAQYYLGRYDIMLHPSKFGELDRGQMHDFDPDPRTGRPIIKGEDGLKKVLACYDSGLLISWAKQWGRGQLRNPAVERQIADHAREIGLPRTSRLVAFAWDRRVPTQPPVDCAALPVPGKAR